MSMNIFTLNHMENMFEIGRIIQNMIDERDIEIEDSKEAFMFALQLALDFEKEYPDTEDYYTDIEEFVVSKIMDKYQ